MPSFPFTPAALTLTPGEIFPEPIRFTFTPGVLALSSEGSDAFAGFGISATSLGDFRLNRLQRQVAITDGNLPTSKFQLDYQRNCEATERAIAALNTQVGDLTALVEAIQTAQATASMAVQTAQSVQARISLADSYTDPVTGVLTASSAGMVTVAAHDRVYATGGRASVNAGSVSGFAPGDFVRVYYNDAARSGGAVTYIGTAAEVVQDGDRHVVGGVAIPAVGEPDGTGSGTIPPGYVPEPKDFGFQ